MLSLDEFNRISLNFKKIPKFCFLETRPGSDVPQTRYEQNTSPKCSIRQRFGGRALMLTPHQVIVDDKRLCMSWYYYIRKYIYAQYTRKMEGTQNDETDVRKSICCSFRSDTEIQFKSTPKIPQFNSIQFNSIPHDSPPTQPAAQKSPAY
jgi:hypothetical protein